MRKKPLSDLSLAGFSSPKDAFKAIRNYLAGQFVGATRDDVLLDEVLKCLFCKLILEVEDEQVIDEPLSLAKQMRGAFRRVRGRFPEFYSDDDEIMLDPQTILFVMANLSFSIMDALSDPIGDAFEVFIGSESKGSSGQFFTPRSVTQFLVNALEPTPNETVLDPACGAGGFLSATCAYLLQHGADSSSVRNWANSNCFGVDKDAQLAKLAKMHVALLTDGHPTVLCGDSLAMVNGSKTLTEYLPAGGVDIVLSNPPFGVKIVAAKPEILNSFELARKWLRNPKSGALEVTGKLAVTTPPQVLFVERSLRLLKPGGRLGIVLPESVLSGKNYRHVVEFLRMNADIEAVVGMPEALFKTSGKGGTHTKTCLVIARRRSVARQSRTHLFMAEAKWCGQDSRARVIPKNDLPRIAINLRDYQTTGVVSPTSLGFVTDFNKIADNVLCPRYYDPQFAHELDLLADDYEMVNFGDLLRDGVVSMSIGDEVGKLAYGTGAIPFVRTSDLSNWEIKADPKHGLSRELYERLKHKQDVRVGDLLMVKDGTYLIGTCAIVTEADLEMVYQSHIYKIRVEKMSDSMNPYLLLALLSCKSVQKQIKSKQFTQDIIDSLGQRIRELVLPVPRHVPLIHSITSEVEEAVALRLRARQLALSAKTRLGLEYLRDDFEA